MNQQRIAYVELSIAVINRETDYDALIEWWKSERDNRAKWHLSADQWPGYDLKKAFDEKRRSIKR